MTCLAQFNIHHLFLGKHPVKIMKKVKQRQSKLVIKRIKAKSGADAVAKKFGEDKEFRTRVVPNKKKDYKIPFDS